MSQQERQAEVGEQTKRMRQGPLKHIRSAALAAVLVPLASFAATPAMAQSTCISGFVWYDANNNGIQDIGETGIAGAVVTTNVILQGELNGSTQTDGAGLYQICGTLNTGLTSENPGYVSVTYPEGFTAPSPANATDDAHDSDGVLIQVIEGAPNEIFAGPLFGPTTTDFGFWHSPVVTAPGTGTPGYWKNHPDAWPVQTITVGNQTFTKAQAIALLSDVGSDKSLTMFSSLVPAMLNAMVGNNASCVQNAITAANIWMSTPPPAGAGFVGSKVKASSLAWKNGEPLHTTMDRYNNGMLCAPHRD